jgi:hypothetical protein
VLSTPEWKSIPWQTIPKNLKDVLVDVLVDMPRLVQAFDEMKRCTEPSKQATLRENVVQKCWEHDQQLLAWSNLVFQEVNAGPQPCADPLSVDLVTRIAQVHGMSLFWTTSLILYSILQMATDSEEDLPSRMDPMHHAGQLVHAISILLQPIAGLYGQQSAALPLEVAIQYTAALISRSPSAENQSVLNTLRGLKVDLANGLERMLKENAGDEALAGGLTRAREGR